jgi:hypothetical protein
VAAVERVVSSRVPTRWIAQMEAQLENAERRLKSADARLASLEGGRALEEVYPGLMGAAMVRVWLTDEPWHTTRSLADLSRLVREALPSGFATLFDMKLEQRSFTGWRAEDARPLVEEARTFVAEVRAEVERCKAPPTA